MAYAIGENNDNVCYLISSTPRYFKKQRMNWSEKNGLIEYSFRLIISELSLLVKDNLDCKYEWFI